MIKKCKSLFFVLPFFVFLGFLDVAQAASTGGCPPGKLCNPLKFNTISELLSAVIDVVILIAIPISILAIIYSGFLFVTAQGNQEKLTQAKKTLFWTAIGIAVLLGAKVIAAAIQGTIDAITR